MSTANPTPLRVGMSGMLNGRRYTVRGRVVLSMVADDGEKYFWNEFDMVEPGGTTATLVFEEEEDGPTWKWFTLLEPKRPLTAEEAARKTEGDTIEFESRQIPITLVDQTRVEFIEGQAPEDVEVGDVADYFNADAGNGRMFVASWTDGEIEFYLGRDLATAHVDAAFGIRTPRAEASLKSGALWTSAGGGQDWAKFGKVIVWIAIILGYVGIQLADGYERPARVAPPPEMKAAPTLQLPFAINGTLGGREYQVAAHAEASLLLKGARFREREYWLREANGAEALLAHGWAADPENWVLMRRVEPAADFTAYQAAALRRGASFDFDGRKFLVTEIFLTRVAKIDGPAEGSPWPGTELYGLLARNGDEWMYCRWTEREMKVFVGRRIPSADVMTAFVKR